MKKVITLLLCMLSLSCFASNDASLLACGVAPDTTDPKFCGDFKLIAQCHCVADSNGRLPADKCLDTKNFVYANMIATFKTQERACNWQATNGSPERTSYQTCMDDWNCYMKGGVDSKGGLCNGTGNPCE